MGLGFHVSYVETICWPEILSYYERAVHIFIDKNLDNLHFIILFSSIYKVVKKILPPGEACWVLLYKHDFHRW